MTPTALSPGQVLSGRYRIDTFIGSSELAEVYGAMDLTGGRECALKLFAPELRNFPQAFAAFQELSRSVARAAADSVARATDFGVDPGLGRPFAVGERIAFPSVAELVLTKGPIDPALWGAALAAFSRALDAAAAVNIAHGDLKPSNLFFSPEHPGWARVSDFGVLALRAQCRPASGVAPLGWAAIEQIQSAQASPASDVFSLGLVTFFALTGRHYLSTMWSPTPDPQAVLAELWAERGLAREHARALGSDLPEALDAWFSRALSRDPAQRFQRAGVAAQAFAAALPAVASLPAETAGASAPMPSVAAAVAAPLLFQDLPRAAATADVSGLSPGARTATPHDPQRSSSRPPGYAAPRALSTEHVAGLPPKPPVAVFVAVGAVLLLFFVGSAFAVLRWAFGGKPEPLAASEGRVLASASASPAPSAPAPAAVAASAVAPSITGAHLECTPERCEWIVCDGEKVKTGTVELPLAPGRHNCSASRYGYRTAVVAFDVEPGKRTSVVFELLAAKPAVVVAPAPARRAPTKAPVKAPAVKATATPSKAAKVAGKPAVTSKSTAPAPAKTTTTTTTTKAGSKSR